MSELLYGQASVGADHGLPTSTKLVSIYGRVSTARQEEEGTIETQLAVLRDFARQHGHTIVKEYIDDGWSGDILARPALDALRQDAKARIWQAVLIYDPDRLARRYSYQELVMDELREAGIEVMFMTVPAPKNSEEKILHGVRGLFAEYERAKIAERFRLGKLRKAKDGHVVTSRAPYGYRYIRKNGSKHGHYEIDANEARTVKMIFQWVAEEGLAVRQIIRRLHESGIRPQESKRGTWQTSTISNLLRNTTYIGEARWGARRAVVPEKPLKKDVYRKIKKSSRRWRPREEWITIPVPAIINKELYEQVRRRLESNAANARRNTKNEYLLTGKMRCVCGRTRAGEGPQNGKYLYYRCTDKVSSFPLPPSCKERGVNARIADRLVWQELVGLMSSPEQLLKQIEQWSTRLSAKAANYTHEFAEAGRETVKLKEQETRYNKAYGAGLFSLGQLREYTEPIRTRIAILERRRAELAGQAYQPTVEETPDPDDIRRFADHSRLMLQDLQFCEKRSIVLNVVEKIVATQQLLRVYGYIPLVDYVEMRPDHRHGVHATRQFGSSIPFELAIALPPPLKRGVEYGFGVTRDRKRSAGDGEYLLAA
jgi:site-specific DNA recombinase